MRPAESIDQCLDLSALDAELTLSLHDHRPGAVVCDYAIPGHMQCDGAVLVIHGKTRKVDIRGKGNGGLCLAVRQRTENHRDRQGSKHRRGHGLYCIAAPESNPESKMG